MMPGILFDRPSGSVASSGASAQWVDSSQTGAQRRQSAINTPMDRIAALDFTKGLLVLIMVLYHWLNYFVSTTGFYYRYLRFLTPSFIFITGFLISHVYLAKYGVANPKLPRRLLHRGLKLLAIFGALNMAITLVPAATYRHAGDVWTIEALASAYLTGNGSAAFAILVPISYLLLVAAGLVIASRTYRHATLAACLASVVCVLILEGSGIRNGYLELLSVGMIGIACGYIPRDRIAGIVSHPRPWLAAYAVYLCSISLWREMYLLQIVGVCLTLALIYMVGTASSAGRLAGQLVLLGRYSLFGYISQIVILQALRSGLPDVDQGSLVVPTTLIAGVVLTLLAVQLVDDLRARAKIFNRLYLAVFS